MNAAMQNRLMGACKALLKAARGRLDAAGEETRVFATGIDDDKGLYVDAPVVDDYEEAAESLVAFFSASPYASPVSWAIFDDADTLVRALLVPMCSSMRFYLRDDVPIPPEMLQSDSYGSMRHDWLMDHMRAWAVMWLYLGFERLAGIEDGPIGDCGSKLDDILPCPRRELWSNFSRWCDGLEQVDFDEHAKRDLQDYVLDGVRPPSGEGPVWKLEGLLVMYIRMSANGCGKPRLL